MRWNRDSNLSGWRNENRFGILSSLPIFCLLIISNCLHEIRLEGDREMGSFSTDLLSIADKRMRVMCIDSFTIVALHVNVIITLRIVDNVIL